jgi:hypothetical protein
MNSEVLDGLIHLAPPPARNMYPLIQPTTILCAHFFLPWGTRVLGCIPQFDLHPSLNLYGVEPPIHVPLHFYQPTEQPQRQGGESYRFHDVHWSAGGEHGGLGGVTGWGWRIWWRDAWRAGSRRVDERTKLLPGATAAER